MNNDENVLSGNPIPPKKDGVMRLYSMRFCPCAQRVRTVLLLKKIPYEVVNINLANKPKWIWELNPEGKIPVLDTGSEVLAESLDICEYLNVKYPNPPLHSDDKRKQEADRKLIEKFQEDKAMFFTVILNENKKTLAQHAKEYLPILEEFDEELSKRGIYYFFIFLIMSIIDKTYTFFCKFFGGDSPNMVDYMIYPWVQRGPVAYCLYNEDYRLPAGSLPHLRVWSSKMSKLEVVKLSNTFDIHRYAKYYKQYPVKASVEYDN
ncbi:glutathione s-transferase n-terminal domain [Holotrichia oblita]|uniref:Glutathione s-transferase n-terminal domain n=1 Tax=Holotrichia oblita TaxID=644536 RepID=A0ACB9TWG3_HOLOL|nr:glutathione s-transferase n-terminal domain [Holotrichia oblita]